MQTLAQLSVVFVSLVSITFGAGCGYTHTASAKDVSCQRSKAGCSQPNAPRTESTTTVTSAPSATPTTFLPPSQPPGTPTNQPPAFSSAPMAPPPSVAAMSTPAATPDNAATTEEAAPAPRPSPRGSSKKARRAPVPR